MSTTTERVDALVAAAEREGWTVSDRRLGDSRYVELRYYLDHGLEAYSIDSFRNRLYSVREGFHGRALSGPRAGKEIARSKGISLAEVERRFDLR